MKNNKVMKIVLGLIVVLCCIGLCAMFSKKSTENQTTMNDGSDVLVADESVEESLDIAIDPAYKLVWEDNFDGAELNRVG